MNSVYNWADDNDSGMTQAPPRPATPPLPPAAPPTPPPPRNNDNGVGRASRAASAAGAAAGGFMGAMGGSFVPPISVNINGGGNGGSGGRGGTGTPAGGGGAGSNRQGDGMIAVIERIEFRGEKDILDLAKAINRLGRELHFIISMRAEEINGVLATYKGKWYTFGSSSRVKARLVSAHLKVSAEAAKALGVGALKMAHAFDRHFVKPEQEARRRKNGQQSRREFSIGDS